MRGQVLICREADWRPVCVSATHDLRPQDANEELGGGFQLGMCFPSSSGECLLCSLLSWKEESMEGQKKGVDREVL